MTPLPDGEVDGTPSNGEREASASQEAIVDSDLRAYTFATILKTQDGEATSAGAAGPSEDTISYNLNLRVENTDPTGNGFSAAALEGTQVQGISADATDKRILVSDAIPAGTVFESVTAPTGGQWQAVYTIRSCYNRRECSYLDNHTTFRFKHSYKSWFCPQW